MAEPIAVKQSRVSTSVSTHTFIHETVACNLHICHMLSLYLCPDISTSSDYIPLLLHQPSPLHPSSLSRRITLNHIHLFGALLPSPPFVNPFFICNLFSLLYSTFLFPCQCPAISSTSLFFTTFNLSPLSHAILFLFSILPRPPSPHFLFLTSQ